jgi:DNA (cytosine-5)-methyltransferase 3A
LFGDLVCKIPQPPNRGILLKDILEKDFEKRYYLSEKMILGFLNHNKIHLEKKQKSGFTWNPTYGDKKAACLRANAALAPTDNSIIVASRGRIGTEIKNIQQLEPRYDGKTNCLTSVQKDNLVALQNQKIRRLTPIECERLQTVPDNYTKLASDSQRYKMLGNGWTVDVIAHIFSYL